MENLWIVSLNQDFFVNLNVMWWFNILAKNVLKYFSARKHVESLKSIKTKLVKTVNFSSEP